MRRFRRPHWSSSRYLEVLSEKGEWMKRSKWLGLVAMLAVFALIGAACGDDAETPSGEGDGNGDVDRTACTWVIGTMGALSGDYASVGQPIADGVEYAINQANEA